MVKSRIISWKEIRQHNTVDDAWIVIHRKVYNITSYTQHPGGNVIYTHAGEDATDIFSVFHTKDTHKHLNQFEIGVIHPDEDSTHSQIDNKTIKRSEEFMTAYRKLRLNVQKLGLYDTRLDYYAWKVTSNLWILSFSIALCLWGNSTWIFFFASLILGIFYQQCGWLCHDICHHQVFKNRLYGDLCGILIGNVMQGFSVQWWKNKHNQHHAVPNLHVSKKGAYNGDPDINTMPLLAWSIEMARKVENDNFGKFMVKYQAWFYFPLLLFARLSWLAQSFIYVFYNCCFGRIDKVQYGILERSGLIFHYSWNLALVYFSNMSFFQGIFFLLVSQASCGIFLALVFSVGHNGMSVYGADMRPDFWNLQVTTTRNITNTPFINWFMGGLQYQVDHHLFPMVPRHNLPRLNELVKSFCKNYGVPYHETTLWQGTCEVIKHLADISYVFINEFPGI